MILALSAVLVALLGSLASAESNVPPNGYLEVAYRQRVEGKLSDSVHSIKLLCSQGSCSLTTLTLNQCFGSEFYPSIQSTSTEEGNLKIVVRNDHLLVAEETDSEARYRYQFEYKTRAPGDLAKHYGPTPWFDRLTGFSGGVMKDSAILNKVISWDLVPLEGEWVKFKPTCTMLLKGVPK